METNIFERATRRKLRFDTSRGEMPVEELWALPLKSDTGKPNLDDIGKHVMASIKDTSTGSLVDGTETSVSTDDQLRLEILKSIIATKKAENILRIQSMARREERATIEAALTAKKRSSLESMSPEELEQLLANLDAQETAAKAA